MDQGSQTYIQWHDADKNRVTQTIIQQVKGPKTAYLERMLD